MHSCIRARRPRPSAQADRSADRRRTLDPPSRPAQSHANPSGGGAMPVRVIGMIGVAPPTSDATLHVLEGGLSPDYVTQFARAHEAAGFDLALVGYTASSAEGFLVALHAAARTGRLGYLIAHRPGFVAPT